MKKRGKITLFFIFLGFCGPFSAAAQSPFRSAGLQFEAKFGVPDEVVIRGQSEAVRVSITKESSKGTKETRHFIGPGGRRIDLLTVADEVVVGYDTRAAEKQDAKTALKNLVRSKSSAALHRGRERIKVDMAAEDACALMAAQTGVRYAYPVLYDLAIPGRVMPTDELVVCVKAGADIDALAARYGVQALHPLQGTENQWIVALGDPKTQFPLEVANALSADPAVEWAEPDFIVEGRKSVNDPLYVNEWHLESTGQNIGGKTPLNDNDVDAAAAWAEVTGLDAMVVAIVDDGVQTAHPDLQANIYVNAAESGGTPGVDDDGNGYVDDVSGWNFVTGNNDPNPADANDNHGTSVAGVTAAVGDNGVGVAGAAYAARILPVKMAAGTDYATDSELASAFRYAASLAKVINFSWSWGSSSTVQSALRDARQAGALPFAAAGNDYGWSGYTLTGFPTGSFTHKWQYEKDTSAVAGEDTAWLDLVKFPDGSEEGFDSVTPPALPSGWSTGGNANWTTISSPADLSPTRPNCAKAGAISHSQTTYLQVTHNNTSAGNLQFIVRTSSEDGYDGVQYYLGATKYFDLISGVPSSSVAYPAYFDEVVCVGALNSDGFRSNYSQVGAPLDFVTPSGCIFTRLKIETTDRTGADGYNTASGISGDYCYASDDTGFSGTSSATPLASGIAALVRAANPALSPAQVRDIMRETCDKVDSTVNPYSGRQTGRNNNLGYGRVNAYNAVMAAKAAAGPAAMAADLKITEVADDPAGLEFVEIYNASVSTSYSLNDLAITDDEALNDTGEGSCRFPEGYSLPAQGMAVVVVGTGTTQAFVDEITANASGAHAPAGGVQVFETVNSGLLFGGNAIPDMEVLGGADPDLTDSDNVMLVITDGYEITFLNEVLDGVVYGSLSPTTSSYFGVGPSVSETTTFASNSGLNAGSSLQRWYPFHDTDDSAADFRVMTRTPGVLPPPGTVAAHSSPQADLDLPNWRDTETEKMSVLKFAVRDQGLDGLATLIDRISVSISGTAGHAGDDIVWAELRGAAGRVATASSITDSAIVFGASPNADSTAQLDTVGDNAAVEYTVNIYLNTALSGQQDETYVFDIDETGVGADGGNSSPMGTDSSAVTPVTGTLFIAALGITVTPGSWNIGAQPAGISVESGAFTLENTGNTAEDVSIESSDASHGWVVQSAPGQNAFRLEADRNDDGSYEITAGTSPQVFAGNVPVSGSESFGLRYSSPSSDTYGAGLAQDFTVTLRVSIYAP